MPNRPQSPSGIQSVQRAIAVLRCFAKTASELGVIAISRELGLHKSTVSRLLSTLQAEGFVEQNPETGKYRLGLELVTLGGIVLERIDLQKLAQPHLLALAENTRETVNVAVLAGGECMNIAGAPSPRPIQYVGRIGRRTPVHCTAAGKILLAHMSPEQRQPFLSKPLLRFTPHTVIDPDQIEASLADILRQGYAITHEEHQAGLSTAGVPIFDHLGHVVAALTVSGPTYRLEPDIIQQIVPLVQATAKDISAQLGFLPPD